MRALLLLLALGFFYSCDEDAGGTQIRLINETDVILRDISYSFGFTEEASTFARVAPGRASDYRTFTNADRCSGWQISGTFDDGLVINWGPALCAIPAPMPPGKYSLLVRREVFDNDGELRTFVRTDIVED